MFKNLAHRLALSLVLTLLAVPVSRMYAQVPDPPTPGDVVTGGDPEPTGEPSTSSLPAPSPTPATAVVNAAWLG